MTSGDRRRDWKQEAEERRQAEMARGREVGAIKAKEAEQINARDFISQSFNPNHVPDPRASGAGISPEERRRRDEYRNRLSRTNGGQNQ